MCSIRRNERRIFWLSNLTEIKNGGMKDTLIMCTDNLAGVSDAIGVVYPKTKHWGYVFVHQIRNSFKYVL